MVEGISGTIKTIHVQIRINTPIKLNLCIHWSFSKQLIQSSRRILITPPNNINTLNYKWKTFPFAFLPVRVHVSAASEIFRLNVGPRFSFSPWFINKCIGPLMWPPCNSPDSITTDWRGTIKRMRGLIDYKWECLLQSSHDLNLVFVSILIFKIEEADRSAINNEVSKLRRERKKKVQSPMPKFDFHLKAGRANSSLDKRKYSRNSLLDKQKIFFTMVLLYEMFAQSTWNESF